MLWIIANKQIQYLAIARLLSSIVSNNSKILRWMLQFDNFFNEMVSYLDHLTSGVNGTIGADWHRQKLPRKWKYCFIFKNDGTTSNSRAFTSKPVKITKWLVKIILSCQCLVVHKNIIKTFSCANKNQHNLWIFLQTDVQMYMN